jgi:hypothetical protein
MNKAHPGKENRFSYLMVVCDNLSGNYVDNCVPMATLLGT